MTTGLCSFGLFCAVLAAAPVAPAAAMTDGQLCADAAARAAAATGVPLAVLTAIARAESGRAAAGSPVPEPWPWTLNAGGRGEFLPDRAAARARAEELLAQGQANLDLGCFQINHHWHGAAFASVEAMLDPTANALYAAEFLAELYAEAGDWRAAAAAYHSRDPERAEAYVRRLEALHARAAAAGVPAPPPGPPPLRFTLTRAAGALLTAARGPLVGAP